jgi:hypothetical protein
MNAEYGRVTISTQEIISGCSDAYKAHMEWCVASNGNYFLRKNRQI